jgi:glucuronosyltransferase
MSARVAMLALVLFLALLAHGSEGAKILAVFPFPAPSHLAIGTALTKGLAAKGHEVTAIVPSKTENLPPNYRELVIGFDFKDLAGGKLMKSKLESK